MIVIESKRKKLETILRRYPGAVIADVTSHAGDDLVKLSPFYPHGGGYRCHSARGSRLLVWRRSGRG